MQTFIEKLTTDVLRNVGIDIHADEGGLQFIKDKKRILSMLVQSKKTGGLIGIHSPQLGRGMFLTVVNHIYLDDKEEVVAFKPYDASGKTLQKTVLSLSEISSVCVFYDNGYSC